MFFGIFMDSFRKHVALNVWKKLPRILSVHLSSLSDHYYYCHRYCYHYYDYEWEGFGILAEMMTVKARDWRGRCFWWSVASCVSAVSPRDGQENTKQQQQQVLSAFGWPCWALWTRGLTLQNQADRGDTPSIDNNCFYTRWRLNYWLRRGILPGGLTEGLFSIPCWKGKMGRKTLRWRVSIGDLPVSRDRLINKWLARQTDLRHQANQTCSRGSFRF